MSAPANDTDVGGIVAHLRVTGGAEWAREFEEAQRRAEALGRVNPHVRITTNNVALMADIAALRARLEALGNDNTTLRFDLTQAQRQIEELRQRTGRQGGVAGRDFGAQFARGLRESMAAIPKIEVNADTSDANRELQAIRAQMEELSRKKIGVDITAEEAMREMARLQALLQTLRATSTDIDVDFNTAAATARIARLQAQLNGVTVTPNIDQGQFSARLARAIQQATAALPDIRVDADSSPVERELAEIRARMVALGEQKIGVDISAADAMAQMKALQGELDRLSRKAKDDLRVRMDTAAASAKLAALQAQLNGLGATRAGGSAGSMAPPLIIAAIIAGVSIAGPLLAAATAGAVALTGAVGGAALAYKGLADAEERSTSTGVRLRGEVKGIGAELDRLGVIAADRAAPGVLGALSKIRAYMPELRGPIAGLSRHLGQALNIGTAGTITALRVMEPLLDDAGKGAEFLAREWAEFAASPRFAQFVDYAREQLPIVTKQVGELSGSVVQLAQDLAPLGENVLKGLVGFGKGVNKAFEIGRDVRDFMGKFDDPFSRKSSSGPKMDPAAIQQAAQAQGLVAEYERRAAVARQRAADATTAQEAALQKLATQYGVTVPQIQAVIEAEDKAANQLAQTTLAMQRQNDASGLLKAALDELSGKELTAAQSQNAFEQSIVSGARALESQKEAAKDLPARYRAAATSVTGLSEAAIANRSSLLSQVTAAMSAAGATGDLARSTDAAKAKLAASRQQIIDNAVAHGANRKAVTAYIDKFLDLSKLKPARTSAEFNADAARARANDFRRFLGTLPKSIRTAVALGGVSSAEYQLQLLARNRTARINVVTTGGVSYQQSVGGRQAFSGGGTVRGEGGPREDKVIAEVSPGEEIINAYQSARWRPLLKAINAGKFADGGTVGSNLVSLTPRPTLSESRAAATEAAKAKAAAKVKVKIEVDAITATAGGGQAYGIASFIRGQIPSAAAASRLLALAVDNAFDLKGMQARVASIRAHLNKAREEQQSLRSGVTSKLSEGADPGQFANIQQYTAFLQAKAAQNERYGAQIDRLRDNKAIPADMLARFAAEGSSAILDSLAGGSRNDIAAMVKASARFNTSVVGGSRQAAAIYGPSIAKDTANLNKALAQSQRTENAMINATLQLARIVNRPVTIKLDGKTVAHTQFNAKELQGVINDLRRVLVTGRTDD